MSYLFQRYFMALFQRICLFLTLNITNSRFLEAFGVVKTLFFGFANKCIPSNSLNCLFEAVIEMHKVSQPVRSQPAN